MTITQGALNCVGWSATWERCGFSWQCCRISGLAEIASWLCYLPCRSYRQPGVMRGAISPVLLEYFQLCILKGLTWLSPPYDQSANPSFVLLSFAYSLPYSRRSMLKMNLLGPIPGRFCAWGRKCSKWTSWGLFWAGSGPQARNTQNDPPETYSGQVLCLIPEMLKMSLLNLILTRFWATG